MIRHCDGNDPHLTGGDGEPCHCGITFDDVEYEVIYPHRRIPSRAEKEAAFKALQPILDDLLKEE